MHSSNSKLLGEATVRLDDWCLFFISLLFVDGAVFQRMKPDWDKLGSEYEGSSSVLIADVDCTVESDLCQRFEVIYKRLRNLWLVPFQFD